MILRRWLQGHKTLECTQGPDRYARARCKCGATFDGRFMLYNFQQWERGHETPMWARPGAMTP